MVCAVFCLEESTDGSVESRCLSDMQAFLSRLLLMLGSFVIMCLLLF